MLGMKEIWGFKVKYIMVHVVDKDDVIAYQFRSPPKVEGLFDI